MIDQNGEFEPASGGRTTGEGALHRGEGTADVESRRREILRNQSLFTGIMAGFVVGSIGILLWGELSPGVSAFGDGLSIGVGLLIGLAIRYLGRGTHVGFGLLAAFLTIIAFSIGKVHIGCKVVARENNLAYSYVLSLLDLEGAINTVRSTFLWLDIPILVVSAAAAFWVSYVPVERRVAKTLEDDSRRRVADRHPASLTYRALEAVLLMIGFYFVAFGVIALLLFMAYLGAVVGRFFHGFLIFAFVGAAVTILISIVPRRDVFDPPWPKLHRKEEPRLFEKLDALAKAADEKMPEEVYLTPEFNAWVAHRGGVLGLGSRRVIGIGLPLLQLLSVSELTSVLAHEFGHYHGGDTRLGPWIYKTRNMIIRTLVNLRERPWLLRAPFEWYAEEFARITHAASRAQEYAADAYSARVTSANSLITALKLMHGHASACEWYWTQLVYPTLAAGYRPSLVGGLEKLFGSKVTSEMAVDVVEAEMKEEAQDPFDTHPPLGDRVAALEELPGNGASDETPEAALSLLSDVSRTEDQIVRSVVPEGYDDELKPIDWEDVGEKVFLPRWQAFSDRVGYRFREITVGRLPDLMGSESFPELSSGLLGTKETIEDQTAAAFEALVAVFSVALLSSGWELHADPGDGFYFGRGDYAIECYSALQLLAVGAINPDEWRKECVEMGVMDLPLWSD